MELHKKEKEKKHALALLRERDALNKQKYSIEAIKLDKPIHHGYVRSLELRDDIKNRKDYPKILEIINFIGQQKVYHQNKDFIVYKGKKHKHEKHAYLKSITDPRYKIYYTENQRIVDLEKIKSFERYLRYHNLFYDCDCMSNNTIHTDYIKCFRPHYYFKFPWMLKEVTKPHYLTHYTPVQGELETRLHEINTELYHNNYYNKYFNNRRVSDKIYKENWVSTKYDDSKSIIYHSLDNINKE